MSRHVVSPKILPLCCIMSSGICCHPVLALSTCTSMEQDGCKEQQRLGEPIQHSISIQGTQGSLPHSMGLRKGEGCGDHPSLWQFPAQGALMAPELPAPQAHAVKEANAVCKVQDGPGLVCPCL